MSQRFFNPAPQFFYSGTPAAPLAGGLMYFYESGTDTPKNTYSDSALTVANSNPVVLTSSGVLPNVFLSGSYKVVLTDKDGVQQPGWPRDPVSSVTETAFAAWDSTFTYGAGGENIVYASNGVYYVSIQAPNVAHEPSASPLYWKPAFDYFAIGQLLVGAGRVAIGDATTGLAGVNINAKGSLLAGNGTLPVEVPVGMDGYALVANSGNASGLGYALLVEVSIPRIARTSDTILAAGNKGNLIDVTSGTFTQTFTAAATLGSGWFAYYRNSGTGIVTLNPNGSETIDGATTFTVLPGEQLGIQCDGSNFYTFEKILLPRIVRSARTSNTILAQADNGTLLDFTSGTFSQTLTAAATLGSGWYVWARNSGTGVVTWDPDSGELIGGVATAIMNPGDVWLVQCTGAAFSLVRLQGANSQIYTSGSGNFAVPAGVYRLYAELNGAGGGCTGAQQAGGGGGRCEGWLNVTPGAAIAYAVGAGTTGAGGNTTFSTLTANGGATGATTAAGGTASGGDINITGGYGMHDGGDDGIGGSSPCGASSVARNGAGVTAGNAPGGGGVDSSGATTTGGAGQIVVRWV
jgi:hypothetical protein